MRDINKKFSVRYYINLVLVDEEERRYFKQQVREGRRDGREEGGREGERAGRKERERWSYNLSCLPFQEIVLWRKGDPKAARKAVKK